eukprot:scaffold49325_cov61-Cyclotella_meneghiniana.AAC.3
MSNSQLSWTNRRYSCPAGDGDDRAAKSAEVEAALTPPGELALALALGVHVSGLGLSGARGSRLKSRPLLRKSGQKCRRWVPTWFNVHFADCAGPALAAVLLIQLPDTCPPSQSQPPNSLRFTHSVNV